MYQPLPEGDHGLPSATLDYTPLHKDTNCRLQWHTSTKHTSVPVSDEVHSLINVVDGEDRQHWTKNLVKVEGRGVERRGGEGRREGEGKGRGGEGRGGKKDGGGKDGRRGWGEEGGEGKGRSGKKQVMMDNMGRRAEEK